MKQWYCPPRRPGRPIASPRDKGGLTPAQFRIVTLCGSSGALTAYVEILHSMAVDTGMAFVVLTHRRDSKRGRYLIEILSRATPMHVEEILDGTIIQPNRVYTNPPGQEVTTDGDTFWLDPLTRMRGLPNTFDIFLASVAQNTRDRAITVILSGLAQDGSDALESLQNSGGCNYAQRNAECASMPDSAISTGFVDCVGTPAEIVAAILKLPHPCESMATKTVEVWHGRQLWEAKN